MLIECKLKRPGGTKVDIGKKHYHFVPLDDGAHVADVQDEEHEARFLSISEAYRVYKGSLTPQVPTETAAPEAPAPKNAKPYWSDKHPESFEIGDKTYGWQEVLDLALAASGLSVDAWNSLDAESRAAFIDAELDNLSGDDGDDGGNDGDAERADLAAQYKEKVGRAPHHTWDAERIRAELAK